ncbi:hypothetical protein IW152_000529 [Coemansia sp. BCRC 34962]|nr:hypothetical protein IW152_000529 [Coemansia sp. BCRC 34962]
MSKRGNGDAAKKAQEEARKARIAKRKEEAEKKAKEAAEKQARIQALAKSRWPITRHLKAQLFKGAVIVNVCNIDQAQFCQEVGVTAICAHNKSVLTPQQNGNPVRMSSPEVIKRYINSVIIPVFTNVRVGHLMEAKIMESIGVDMIEESDTLTSLVGIVHFSKRELGVPTICTVGTLKDCLLRIQEGALILRTSATRTGGNVNEALKVIIGIQDAIKGMRTDPKARATLETDVTIYQPLLKDVIDKGCLPVPIFGAGGIHTPTDVAMMMNAGCDGVFIDNTVFFGIDPEGHLKAIIQVVKNPNDVSKICELSANFI